jgi:uncharacterized protein (TIGR01619 family)
MTWKPSRWNPAGWLATGVVAFSGAAGSAAESALTNDADQWDFYPLRVDDQPASIFLNMSLAQRAPVRGFERMAYLRVIMRAPRDDGLSSQDEYDRLIEVEEGVIAEIEKDGATGYVGRNTSSGNRDFFFYTRDAAAFERAARKAMQSYPEYRFETGGRPDSKWSTYFDFLYPSPLDIQRMGNRAVLRQLEEAGDVHDAVRAIDHMVVFRDKAATQRFAAFVRSRGFEVTSTAPAEHDPKVFHVEFKRQDRASDIDAIVDELYEAARKHGGEYDGWASEVVRAAT